MIQRSAGTEIYHACSWTWFFIYARHSKERGKLHPSQRRCGSLVHFLGEERALKRGYRCGWAGAVGICGCRAWLPVERRPAALCVRSASARLALFSLLRRGRMTDYLARIVVLHPTLAFFVCDLAGRWARGSSLSVTYPLEGMLSVR